MFHLDDAPTVKNHNLFQPCKTDKKKKDVTLMATVSSKNMRKVLWLKEGTDKVLVVSKRGQGH